MKYSSIQSIINIPSVFDRINLLDNNDYNHYYQDERLDWMILWFADVTNKEEAKTVAEGFKRNTDGIIWPGFSFDRLSTIIDYFELILIEEAETNYSISIKLLHEAFIEAGFKPIVQCDIIGWMKSAMEDGLYDEEESAYEFIDEIYNFQRKVDKYKIDIELNKIN